MDEWDKPQRHLYSASCTTRVELVHIPMSAVKSIIEHFSPWLGMRFEFFRTYVVDSIEKERRGTNKGNDESDKAVSDPIQAGQSSTTTTKDVGTTCDPQGTTPRYRCGTATTEFLPSEGGALVVPIGQENGIPPIRFNYEAFSTMNTHLYSPGTPRFNRGPGLTSRTFRSAAAAAVARVSARVTPPASRQGTPRINTRERMLSASTLPSGLDMCDGSATREPLMVKQPLHLSEPMVSNPSVREPLLPRHAVSK
jgi:hypothetical protein